MGLVMVICNQIGAVSPPTAPLLFVTTNIARTTFDDTTRHARPVDLDPALLPGLTHYSWACSGCESVMNYTHVS